LVNIEGQVAPFEPVASPSSPALVIIGISGRVVTLK
jgi:hypothetical protein